VILISRSPPYYGLEHLRQARLSRTLLPLLASGRSPDPVITPNPTACCPRAQPAYRECQLCCPTPILAHQPILGAQAYEPPWQSTFKRGSRSAPRQRLERWRTNFIVGLPAPITEEQFGSTLLAFVKTEVRPFGFHLFFKGGKPPPIDLPIRVPAGAIDLAQPLMNFSNRSRARNAAGAAS